jgi:hypothetical protein
MAGIDFKHTGRSRHTSSGKPILFQKLDEHTQPAERGHRPRRLAQNHFFEFPKRANFRRTVLFLRRMVFIQLQSNGLERNSAFQYTNPGLYQGKRLARIKLGAAPASRSSMGHLGMILDSNEAHGASNDWPIGTVGEGHRDGIMKVAEKEPTVSSRGIVEINYE